MNSEGQGAASRCAGAAGQRVSMYVCSMGRGEVGFTQVLFFSEKKSH